MQLKTVQQVVEQNVRFDSEHWWLGEFTSGLLTQDRADIRAVLREGLVKIDTDKRAKAVNAHIATWEQGYNHAIDDILTLIDTLLPGDVNK